MSVELCFGLKPLTGVNSMLTHQYRDKNLRSCEVVFQREGYDVETLYWAGSREEVRELAEEIAFRGGATYRIVEFSDSGTGNDEWPHWHQTHSQFRVWRAAFSDAAGGWFTLPLVFAIFGAHSHRILTAPALPLCPSAPLSGWA